MAGGGGFYLWLDIPVNQVSVPQEFESTGKLSEKAPNDDFI
jgi:hypothetical protein